MAEPDDVGNRHLAWIAAWSFIGLVGLGVAVPAALTAGHAQLFWLLTALGGLVVIFAIYMVLTPFTHKWPFNEPRAEAPPLLPSPNNPASLGEYARRERIADERERERQEREEANPAPRLTARDVEGLQMGAQWAESERVKGLKLLAYWGRYFAERDANTKPEIPENNGDE